MRKHKSAFISEMVQYRVILSKFLARWVKHKSKIISGDLVFAVLQHWSYFPFVYVTVNLCNQGIREFPECFLGIREIPKWTREFAKSLKF